MRVLPTKSFDGIANPPFSRERKNAISLTCFTVLHSIILHRNVTKLTSTEQTRLNGDGGNEMKIKEVIMAYFREGNEEHRYKSWEHCYCYFSRENIDKEVAALHLAGYLASFGMYRSSSELSQSKHYLINKDAVSIIQKYKHLRGCENLEKNLDKIRSLYREIAEFYAVKKVSTTDTLVTKVMLGTLGCVPAYDKYATKALRKKRIVGSFGEKSLQGIQGFYTKYEREFRAAQIEIKKNCGIKYPPMKLVDMYFFQTGSSSEK